MGSVLPLVGIAALMVFGFVVLMTALTYDSPPKSERPPHRPSAGERRQQRKQLRRQTHPAPARRSAVRKLVVTPSTRAIELARDSWPRWRYHVRDARVRWLSLESTTGQLIATASISVVVAYLIVAFG